MYISPEDNKGTMFYSDKKGNDEKIIEWKKIELSFSPERRGKLGIHMKEIKNRIELL